MYVCMYVCMCIYILYIYIYMYIRSTSRSGSASSTSSFRSCATPRRRAAASNKTNQQHINNDTLSTINTHRQMINKQNSIKRRAAASRAT